MVLKFTGQFNQSTATHETSSVDNIIGIGTSVSQLRGIGLEYLVKDGQVIAKFWNGNITSECLECTNEITVVSA